MGREMGPLVLGMLSGSRNSNFQGFIYREKIFFPRDTSMYRGRQGAGPCLIAYLPLMGIGLGQGIRQESDSEDFGFLLS